MRVTLTIMLFAAVCSLALAQQAMDTGTHSNTSRVSAQHLTLVGCIAGGREQYTFMQTNTQASFLLLGDPSKFENARGKLVQVRGRELPPNGSEGVKGTPRLQVVKLRLISDKCPIQTAVRQPSIARGNHGQEQAPIAATPKYGSPGAVNQTPPQVGNNPTNWGNGAQGAPSPGTGNAPPPPQSPPR